MNWRNEIGTLLLILGTMLNGYIFGTLLFNPPTVQAAPAAPDVECVEWAKAGPWTITRCEDWSAGETCLIANSGMIVCRFE